MDGASTLVLEGRADTLPSLNVSESASVDGQLVLRISLPPTFSSFGVWQNYTIMTCSHRCHGNFRHLTVEDVGTCTSIADVQEDQGRGSSISIAVLFDKLPTCFSPTFLPHWYYVELLYYFSFDNKVWNRWTTRGVDD